MNPETLRIQDFQYDLPEERIAKYPLAERDQSKLLVYQNEAIQHHSFGDIIDEIPAGALLLFNNTRVIHARLEFFKETGARIEIFCLEPLAMDPLSAMSQTERSTWKCLVGNAKKWKSGSLTLNLPNGTFLTAECLQRTPGDYVVEFSWNNDEILSEILEQAGKIPLPPYLNRKAEESDEDRYQTVYSKVEGSVAAPTAGLHFTPGILDQLQQKGVHIAELTLHVSAGTFQPVKAEEVGDHPMHYEYFTVNNQLIEQLKQQVESGKPILTVGTTSLRALESLFWLAVKGPNSEVVDQWDPYRLNPEIDTLEALNLLQLRIQDEGSLNAQTGIMIAPGYHFRFASGIVTNFHLPQSTLLLLIAALIGEHWKKVYQEALNEGYRFLSYGDSSLLWNQE